MAGEPAKSTSSLLTHTVRQTVMRGLLYGISHTRLHAPSLQNDTEMLVKHPSHTDWKKLSHDTQPHQEELTQTSPFFQMAHLREHTHTHPPHWLHSRKWRRTAVIRWSLGLLLLLFRELLAAARVTFLANSERGRGREAVHKPRLDVSAGGFDYMLHIDHNHGGGDIVIWY